MASRITQAQMRSQADRARKQWPFIDDVEKQYGLPVGYLYAVGSRETNLQNIKGDHGNGLGVWQRDRRWWPINDSYLNDVRKQCTDAASLLRANYVSLGNWQDAASAYNAGLTGVRDVLKAGKTADSATTGGDYGADVMGRLSHLNSTSKGNVMPYLTNLADIARRTGFPVVEQPGWKTRGHGPMGQVLSVVPHHDAANQAPGTFNTVIQNGHGTLKGPLSQYALRRDGTIHVVAAGLCYHAGTVSSSTYSNQHSIGIEAGNNGVGEPWPKKQLDAYIALCAELCKEFGLSASRVQGHKEVAYPRGRKIDPAGIDMNDFRARVAARMQGGGGGSSPQAPARRLDIEYGDNMLIVPKGGSKNKPAYFPIPVSVLREHDLVIAPGVGRAVYVKSLNTWKNQVKALAGPSNVNPGGVGALLKDFTIWETAGKSVIVPQGVAKLDLAYWSDVPFTIGVYPR